MLMSGMRAQPRRHGESIQAGARNKEGEMK